MLFWLFIILTVAGIAAFIFGNEFYDWVESVLYTIGAIFAVVGVIGLIVSSIILSVNHIGVDGYVAKSEARYEQLVYEYENDIYDNDNDLGKKELMNEIREWNEDLAQNKTNQEDFWIGIFIPNIYDQFEFIKLKN